MDNKANITVKFQNINDDRNIPACLPEYQLHYRLPQLLEEDVDVYALSEIGANNVLIVQAELNKRGYKTIAMAYAPNQYPNNSFYHIIGWKRVQCTSHQQYWFTKMPKTPHTEESRKVDSILQKYGESFEKGALTAVFTNGNKSVIVSANHFGLKRNQELQYTHYCAEQLGKFLTRLSAKTGAVVVAGADFNVLPGSSHYDILCQHFRDVTPDGITFCAYPWDLGIYHHDQALLAKCKKSLPQHVQHTPADCIGYIAIARDCFKQLYNGPLTGTLDKIFTTGACNVVMTHDLNKFTLTDLHYSPVIPSDHVGFIVTV